MFKKFGVEKIENFIFPSDEASYRNTPGEADPCGQRKASPL
jgi:hypothetical protein